MRVNVTDQFWPRMSRLRLAKLCPERRGVCLTKQTVRQLRPSLLAHTDVPDARCLIEAHGRRAYCHILSSRECCGINQ